MVATNRLKLGSVCTENGSPLSHSNWDAIAEVFDGVELFHKTQWAQVLSTTYGYRPEYIVFRDDEKIVGLLPMMQVKGWLSGRYGVSLPFTDCCPFLFNDEWASVGQHLEPVLAFGRAKGWRHVELRLDGPIDDTPSSLQFYSHSLDLSIGQELLFKRCSESSRRAIRKAGREEVEIKFLQGVEGAREYYELHCLTRKRHGLPPQPWSFFAALGELCLTGTGGFVTIASVGGRAVAGAVFLISGGRAHYKYGASDERFQNVRGNNLVMWESICRLVQMGARSLSFGRTSLANEGLRKFKLGWGCQETKLHYYRLASDSGRVLPMKDRASGFYNRMFRSLPMPVLRLAGKIAYAHQT